MNHRTIGDEISEAMCALEHAIETEGFDQLPACDRAFVQECLHYLQQI